jgi:membrane protein DedA with SNARE-associated domain
MPLKRYALAQMGGSVVWVAAVMWLGVKTGDQWPWLTDRIEGYASWGIGIALAALGLFVAGTLLSRARRGRRASAAAQTSV